MTILITGGTGYLGSHIAIPLLEAGNNVILFDNLSNSSKKVVSAIDFLCESYPEGKLDFYRGDLKYKRDIDLVFRENNIDAVIHTANQTNKLDSTFGRVDVIDNDVVGTINLLQAMVSHNVNKFVYTSSLDQSSNNFTKPIIEKILEELVAENSKFSAAVLRCVQICGSHLSAILNYNFASHYDSAFFEIFESAMLEKDVMISEQDMDKPLDIVHVLDVANAHINALDFIDKNVGIEFFNIGGGAGYTPKQIIEEFEVCCNKKINVSFAVESLISNTLPVCDISESTKLLNWKVMYDLSNMCYSTYRWALRNKWKK